MSSTSSTLKIIVATILLSVLFLSPSYSQSKKQRNKKDSIIYLNYKIDSLQKAYEELLNAPFEPIEIADSLSSDQEGEPEFLEDAERNTDSLLSIWYLQKKFNTGDAELVNVEDTVLSSNVPDSVYIDRLRKMNSFIQLPYNDIIRNYIVYYTQKMPEKMSDILGLSSYYLPLFEEIFDEYRLPKELKAMAVIESALNPRAVSRAKAKGMWQFIYSTARRYDLQMTSFVDERFDPVRSCRAAAEYLRDSYDIFGDWSLAIASYNCGAGNVNKAIRRSGGGKDFWEIYRYLPRETRGYVPAFVAALYALKYYPEHNLIPAQIAMPAHIDTFHVEKNLHFGQISENIGIPIDEIRDLNPQYIHDIIPGSERSYILKLPYNYSMAFVDKEDEIYGYKDTAYFNPVAITRIKETGGGFAGESRITHKVKGGETLGSIARKYRTQVANIKRWNNLRGSTIRVGQRLVIYGKEPKTAIIAASNNKNTPQTQPKTAPSDGITTYTIKKGDTLWAIANKFEGVTLNDIMTLNGFTRKTKIYPGMKIKIKTQ